MTYEDLQSAAHARQLTILGGFHPGPDDKAPAACKTLVLLGPHEPGFWSVFKDSPEWRDGKPDPMDRWSMRIIGTWAKHLDAEPVFPFGGPPYLPFFSWATRTGRIHVSPIMLLVHDQAGLLVSFRGGLCLPYHLDLPEPPANPCDLCTEKPCRTTCPVDALDGSAYDVAACKSFLDTKDGEECMTMGCRARRACPVSQTYPRVAEQSAYHMSMFNR